MSRHDFENGTARGSIGWDAPIATCFLQVRTGEIDDEDATPRIWLGGFHGEAPQTDPPIAVARRHLADLPATLHGQITVDRPGAPARPRRPGLIDP